MSQNTVCWTDIPVTDLDRAIAFYSAVLGQPVTKQAMGDGAFGMLPTGENIASASLSVCSDNQPSRTGPLIHLSVNGRLDEAVRIAGDSGGEVLQPNHPIGPYGFRAIIVDSEGNRIALHSETA